MKQPVIKFFILAGMLVGLPMLGVICAGFPISRYLEFPPETRYIQHAPFSWLAFIIYCVIISAAIIPLIFTFRISRVRQTAGDSKRRHFPWWGWAAIAAGALSWVLAWNRLTWFAAFQRHTFTPLWVSYILVVNGLTYKQSSRSLMVDRPGYFAALFPLSAAFWWFFEYLNRFVQNWYYTGAQFPAWEYFWYATLPFSTVLPAVLSTRTWISSMIRFEYRRPGRRFSMAPNSAFPAWSVIILSAAGLTAIGIWPDYLFPLLWISPLLIIVSLQSLTDEKHLFSRLDADGWHSVLSAALAALVCGFFWEMWNYFSLARWEYSVPFVNRFHVFEMPILGYAGYLPFGLECIIIGEIVNRER